MSNLHRILREICRVFAYIWVRYDMNIKTKGNIERESAH